MLAALAVVAGGLTVGAGAATAATGSADFFPSLGAGGLSGLVAGSVGADLPYCNEGERRAVQQFEGITADRNVRAAAYPGEIIRSTSFFESVDESESIERYTAYLPAGSTFVSVEIVWVAGTEIRSITHPATSVEKGTGAVTFTGSWPIGAQISVLYTVPLTAKVGSVLEGGFGVTVAGHTPQDWPALERNGTTVVDLCEHPATGIG